MRAGARRASPKTALTEHRAPQFGEICAILPMSRDHRLVFQLAAEKKAVAGDDIGAGNRHIAGAPQSAKCPRSRLTAGSHAGPEVVTAPVHFRRTTLGIVLIK